MKSVTVMARSKPLDVSIETASKEAAELGGVAADLMTGDNAELAGAWARAAATYALAVLGRD